MQSIRFFSEEWRKNACFASRCSVLNEVQKNLLWRRIRKSSYAQWKAHAFCFDQVNECLKDNTYSWGSIAALSVEFSLSSSLKMGATMNVISFLIYALLFKEHQHTSYSWDLRQRIDKFCVHISTVTLSKLVIVNIASLMWASFKTEKVWAWIDSLFAYVVSDHSRSKILQ